MVIFLHVLLQLKKKKEETKNEQRKQVPEDHKVLVPSTNKFSVKNGTTQGFHLAKQPAFYCTP